MWVRWKIWLAVPEGDESIVIHCASMVTTNPAYNPKLIEVNVEGTKNMIDRCLQHPECCKMVYVSSTGAIPELPKGMVIKEVHDSHRLTQKRKWAATASPRL